MKRREFIRRSSAAVAGGLLASALAEPAGRDSADKPNILMITCHDLGRHLGCYGVRTARSDNIDRLADKGIRFANYYSTSAVCSPGRGSLHTGRYPQSNGLLGLTHAPWWWRLNDGERHTAAILKEAGYETYLIGFCHVGSPPALGYERRLSPRSRAEETVLAAQGLVRTRKPGDRPFFAKVGFTEVHRPFTHGSDTERGLFVPPWLQNTPQIREDLAQFQAEIKFFDSQVGRILDTLEKSEIAEDTVVIFTSDHGIPYPGAKWSARKAGIEVPMIIYRPNSALSGGRVFTEPASCIDVLPTLLDFLDIPIPAGVEGVSFRALIEGTSTRPPRDAVFGQFTPAMKRDNLSRCIISGRYQLIRY
ncbi:MAG: sulfatase, partial [Phycisphaerales bacterium]